MTAIWLKKIIYSKLPSTVLGLAFLSILGIAVFTPLAYSATPPPSCSVTSMKAGEGIRACQIEDLRTLINEARAACASGAIAPYAFTDEPIIPGDTVISIRHIDQMKAAINEISTMCVPARTPKIFRTILAGDIISVRDFAYIFNSFVSTNFCGDGICQTSEEDLTTCPVDCGGAAQFYCNNIGGCYANVTCPAGKTCYAAAQDCLDEAPTDCPVCVPDCSCADYKCIGTTCSDGCGGTCAGTAPPDCSCAAYRCVGQTCSDGCGGTCAGTEPPDCSCASDTCTGDTCSDGCGGSCPGTAAPDCSCAADTCGGDTCSDGCGGTCAGTMLPNCDCAADTCSGTDCVGACGGGTCAGTATPDCSCSSYTCWDDVCGNGCGGLCDGTDSSCSFYVTPKCTGLRLYACGSNPAIDGYYYYRCTGTCTPTDADIVSGLINNCQGWTDTGVVAGQDYTYAAKYYTVSTNTYSAFSPTETDTFVGPDCSCASDTCTGDTCSDGCGGSCPGTATPDCSCATSTCAGDTCSNGCGGSCPGTATPDCSCATSTCVGDTCSNGCGGSCAGTKLCAVTYPPRECKKYTCSDNTWCLQDHTETCSCPAGKKPVCVQASTFVCGDNDCPDTTCECVD